MIGPPAAYPNAEKATSIVIALASNKVQRIGRDGQVLATMPLDLVASAGAIVSDLDGNGTPEILAADVGGSIYAFNGEGTRLWKHTRNGKANDYRFIAAEGGLICMGDSRGHLVCLDNNGEPKLQVNVTTYRVSCPAIADLDGDGKPDVVFGTEDKEVIAVSSDGRTLWRTPLDGRFGRGEPVATDLDGDGKPEILIATSYLGNNVGVFALEGATGKIRWHAPSQLQSYHSHLVADLDDDGKVEVVYSDKNTRVFCVTNEGKPKWNVQLEGRGAFWAPAVADLNGDRKLTMFQPVRGGNLFALDGAGKTVGSFAIPGGGNASPIAVKFAGSNEILVVQGDSVKGLHILKPAQKQARLYQGPTLKVPPARGPFREVSLGGGTQPEFPAPAGFTVEPRENPWIAASEAAPPNVTMVGNEYESSAVTLTNRAPFGQDIRVVIPAELRGAVKLFEVPTVLPDATGRPSEDVLIPLNVGNVVHLGANEARTLWLQFRSHHLKPGTVNASLRFHSLISYDKAFELPVQIRVAGVRLPDKRVYRHCNWLSVPAEGPLREAVLNDALEHGTNVIIIPAVSVQVDANGQPIGANTQAHDALVKRLNGKALMLVSGSVGVQWPKDFKPSEEASREAYANALRWYAKHVASIGLAFEDFAFYLQDEPGLMGDDANYRQWMELVKRVKSIEPRFQIYANPAGGAFASVLQPIAHLIDIWQPDLHLVRAEPEPLTKLFSTGKHYWHYEAPADQRNLDPLGFYRAKPWVAFQMGMTGGGYWVYHYSPMWQPDPGRVVEYGVVYMTDNGPVPTKRWEASRDGAEDFELLYMLRARKPDSAVLKEAVAFVTKDQDKASDIARQLRPFRPDFKQWMQYRDRIIEELEHQ